MESYNNLESKCDLFPLERKSNSSVRSKQESDQKERLLDSFTFDSFLLWWTKKRTRMDSIVGQYPLE